MEKMLEEFEGWAKVNGLRLERQRSMCGGDMGRYDFGPTQAALEVWCDAWKESRDSLCVKLPSAWYQDVEGYILNREDDVKSCLDDAGVRYE